MHYINKKFTTLDKYSPHIQSGDIILEEKKGMFNGEVILKLRGTVLTTRARGDAILDVLDALRSKIAVRIKRYEEKIKTRKGRI